MPITPDLKIILESHVLHGRLGDFSLLSDTGSVIRVSPSIAADLFC